MFIDGIVEKFPKELLEKRHIIEGQVIGVLWKSPDLYDDYRDLDSECFITEDGKFYYSLGFEMYKKGYEVFDDTSIAAFISQSKELSEGYYSRGGFENIKELLGVIKSDNANIYIDELHKWNIINGFYSEGFNIMGETEVEGKEIKPIDLFKKMNSEQVADWYEWRVQSITMDKAMGDIKIIDLDLDDEFIMSCDKGEAMGLPYDTLGKDIEGNTVWGAPMLSSATLGVHRGDGELIGAYSGKGKTSYVIAHRVFPIVERNESVCIMANEMTIDKYKKIILPMILAYKFKYFGITRRHLSKGGFSEEQKRWIKKAQDYYVQHYKGKIKFVKLNDYGMTNAKRVVKRLSRAGVNYFLYDTFKAENMADDNTRGHLIENSKQFYRLAEKYNVGITIIMQLAIHTEGMRYLTSACLSEAKGVKEVLSEIILFRELWADEYTDEKYDCKAYRLVKDDLTGKYTNTKEYIKLDPSKKYRVFFLDKTRNGDDSQVIIMEFQGAWNVWKEIGYATISHIDKRGK